MNLIIDKVYNYIIDNNMIEDGDKVMVALSGGPDSVCLLHILYRLKDRFNIKLYAAHLNHCLRGVEADSDEQYAKELCHKLEIKFFSKKVDVEKYAEENGISCEVAGRQVRYSFFEEVKNKEGINKIALAHNANDQAETVLLRIMRGCGVDGLCGIRPVRDKVFIRPILGIERCDIESYCNNNNLNPHIDKTNLENIYTRNKVRLDLIPYLRDTFNKDIIGSLNRLAYTMQGEYELLDEISEQYYEKYCYKEDNKVIIKEKVFSENKNLVARIVRMAYCKLKGNMYNMEKCHVLNVMDLSKSGTGKYTMLPNDIIAYNNYGDIYICESGDFHNHSDNNIDKKFILEIGNEYSIEDMKISLEIVSNDNKQIWSSGQYEKCFDYDNIKEKIILRYRREGDIFNPLGMRGNKLLKKVFIDMKIPRSIRQQVPLICFDEDIAWIVGYNVCDKYKVTKNTKKVLKIKIQKGEN